jgi:O-acetyl-ADP-ribose deacetylase (regulator of RNase III)
METEHAFLGGRVQVVVGDITRAAVDAIVNAANSSLLGGGGVDGAIHRAGGPDILAACKELRRTRFPEGLPTSEAVATTGGNLPARWVIHTVGPIKGIHGDDDPVFLAGTYRNSLRVAVELGARSVAFPAISTGVYGYPKDEAARVASCAIEEFLKSDTTLDVVKLVFFQASDAQVFLQHHQFTPAAP